MMKDACPKCETLNPLDAINCRSCQVNFALHYPEFFKRNQSAYSLSQNNPVVGTPSTNVDRKSYAKVSWGKSGDRLEREVAEIPPIMSEEQGQILEDVIADHEKNGFSVTERRGASIQMFKPKFTTEDVLLRALPAGVFLFFVIFASGSISNQSTARIVESFGPGWLILIALLYVGLPFLFKKDQTIKIIVDESGNIETQDISDSISKE